MQLNITLGAIETKTTVKGAPYTVAQGSTLHKKDGSERTLTVMAFGAQRESVAELLNEGEKIAVTAVFENGVIKILGPKAAPKAAPVAEAA